ncbi:CLUMA_CG009587, isoform A [Clunio marinus]|uniref:CLUMA_CG009587, isoform A n=1 Tax=Clunio marinus TaxID=568069 RepID=A0A1J1IB11_9DIPT|nr:CLUMA_CG009587, isoform A [Clunio marinus]
MYFTRNRSAFVLKQFKCIKWMQEGNLKLELNVDSFSEWDEVVTTRPFNDHLCDTIERYCFGLRKLF